MALDLAEIWIWPRKATPKNPYILVLGFMGNRGDLSTWHRTMEHRGVRMNTLAKRPMTSEEIATEEKQCRLHWIHYKDWPTLLEDEWLVTESPEWIKELITCSRLPLTVEQVIINAAFPKKTK